MKINYSDMDYKCDFEDIESGEFFFRCEDGVYNTGYIKIRNTKDIKNAALNVATGEITYLQKQDVCYAVPTAIIINQI